MGKKKEPAKIPVPVIIIIGVLLMAGIGSSSKTVRHAAGIGTVHVTSASRKAFIRAVLADLGAPKTAANISSLEAWFPHENTTAVNNPMASTMLEPGSTTFNSAGVQNYVSPSEGAHATAATLDDGYYPQIVKALRAGTGLCGDSFAGELLTWSGNGYSEVC
jgi:type II secretory pathway pseudopilin PulG